MPSIVVSSGILLYASGPVQGFHILLFFDFTFLPAPIISTCVIERNLLIHELGLGASCKRENCTVFRQKDIYDNDREP